MSVIINSIWEISGVGTVKDGCYRVLALYHEVDICVIFPISEEVLKLKMPECILISDLNNAICSNECQPVKLNIPAYQMSYESDLPSKHSNKRDEDYSLIKSLVEDPMFLLDLVCCHRSNIVSEHAMAHNTYCNKIYRFLNKYWRYGQCKNALLPAWGNSGGKGLERIAGNVKRGSPVRKSPYMDTTSVYRNVLERDKNIFLKSMKEFSPEGKKKSLSSIYDEMIKTYYASEVSDAQVEGFEQKLPSKDSFRYWIKKLIPANELIERQASVKEFQLNKRALQGSATDHTEVPGSCFELDATVLDVHIVSSFNHSWILGRPTVYLIVDKESRMVVGLHVSMEYASWRAGRQALVNAFTNKKLYCSRFGLEIEDEEWPCNHLPQKLLCDRGEFVCDQPEKLAVPLIGNLLIAPSGRADMKGIVERNFKILNDDLVHQLAGTTNGISYIRGEKDPRLDACLTLEEVTILLIEQILEHNNSTKNVLMRQSLLMVGSDLPLTPLNYWNTHLENHRHALRCANEAEIRAQLLPKIFVSMTEKGIRLNKDMFYQWDSPVFSDLKIIARTSGRWKLEARVDHDNSDFIYVKMLDDELFVRCDLMRMSKIFGRKHSADIEYVMDWNKRKASLPNITLKSIKRYDIQQGVICAAERRQKEIKKTQSKKQRIKNITEMRRNEIQSNRPSVDNDGPSVNTPDLPVFSYRENKINKQIGMLKRIMKTNSDEESTG
ncbi:transposase [Salmonella enterica]|nr:transposase [Salmonella enterica]EAZ0562323.1 transposase family protein [Salmonella enterica]